MLPKNLCQFLDEVLIKERASARRGNGGITRDSVWVSVVAYHLNTEAETVSMVLARLIKERFLNVTNGRFWVSDIGKERLKNERPPIEDGD